MDDDFYEFSNFRIERNLKKNFKKPSYRTCLLTLMYSENYTFENAVIISILGMLQFENKHMDFLLALRNNLHIGDIQEINSNQNLAEIKKNINSTEKLTPFNEEIRNFLIAAKELAEEIKGIVYKKNIRESNKSILKLFNIPTRVEVNNLCKKSFNIFKNFFSSTIEISRQNGKSFKHVVELAVLMDEYFKGFTYRLYIPKNSGMLFDFENLKKRKSRSPNGFCKLSAAYIDEFGVINEIVDLSETPYESKKPCAMILEMKLGWFEKNKVQIGDMVSMKNIIANM